MFGAGSAFVNILPNFGGFGRQISRGINGPLAGATGAVDGLVGKIEEIPDQFGLAGKALDAFTGQALRNISSLGHTIHTKIALAAETAFAGMGVRAFAEVEGGLREVVTLFNESGAQADASLGQVSNQVRALSNELGVAQKTLVDGLYEALSAGIPRENAVDFLRVATKAGIAGVSDTQTAVIALAGTMNAFQIPMSDVEKVADSFFATIQGGITTFPELATNMADVSPVAAATGISLQEVGAAIATLTAAGVRTPEATTQIRAAIQAIAKPSKEMNAIWKEAKFESGEAALRQVGLAKAMQIVQKASGGSIGKMTELLGSIEAVNAVQQIGGTRAAQMATELDRQRDAAGSTSRSFEIMEEGVGRAFGRLQTAAQNFSIVIGEALAPAIRLLTGLLEMVTDLFMSLPKPVQQLTAAFVFLATALGPPAFMIWRLVAAWKTLVPIMQAAKMGHVTGGIMGMSEALKHAGKNTLTFQAAWAGMKALNFAQRGADIVRLGGAFTALRTSLTFLAGPAGIVAGLAVAFGILDSAMSDVEGRLNNLNKIADAKLFEKFFDEATKTTFTQDAGDFFKTAFGFGDEGMFGDWVKDDAEKIVGAFNKVLESGNIGLAQRIRTAATGTGYEQLLNDAFAKHATQVKATTDADKAGAAALAELTGEIGGATVATEELTDAQKAFEKQLASTLDLGDVWSDTLDKMNDDAKASADKSADAVRDAADERYEALKTGLDKEKDALENRHDAELALVVGEGAREAVRQRHERETKALGDRSKAELDAAEKASDAEKKRAEAIEKTAETTKLTAAQTKEAAKKRIAETKQWFGSLGAIAARGGGAIVDELMALGPDAADMVKEVANLSEPEFKDFVGVVEAGSAEAVAKMREQFDQLPGALNAIGQKAGTAVKDGLIAGLKAGELMPGQIIAIQSMPMVPAGFIGPLQPGVTRAAPIVGGANIREFQHGGRFGRGQWGLVGEAGPELVRFGAGGAVTPNHELAGVGGRGGVTIENLTVPTVVDATADEVAGAIGTHLAWRIGRN